MAVSETAEHILDIAEKAARTGGYNAFSFREIAAEIGIKSASVHYHFPTKENLGAALAQRYTERFMQALGPADAAEPAQMLQRYAEAYQRALQQDGLMCLCGMFGSEINDLPEQVAQKTRAFFERNMAWLQRVYQAMGEPPEAADIKAARLIATLEGAMILSQSLNDPGLMGRIVAELTG